MTEHLSKLLTWTRVFLVFLGLIYLCLLVGITSTFFLDPTYLQGEDAVPMVFTLGLFICFLLPFTLSYLVNTFLINKQSKWVYYLTMVNIALGFTGFPTAIFAVILFIKWLEPEVKEYYLGAKKSAA